MTTLKRGVQWGRMQKYGHEHGGTGLKGKILHHSITDLRLLFSMIGFIQELHPASKVSNEEFNSIINSVCCGARRRLKRPRQEADD